MRQFLQQRCLQCQIRSFLEKLKAYSAEMKDTVQAKADRLAEVGYEEYLNNK